MNYDSNVQLPEIVSTIADVAEYLRDNRLINKQSLFLENFPLEHLSVLNSVILTGYNVGIYTKADPVFGGAGVRIFSIADVKVKKRTYGDWTATRNSTDVWKERIGKWFNCPIYEMAFYWNKSEKRVEVLYADDGNDIADDWFAIAPHTAFAFMCTQGEHYRGGKYEPIPDENTQWQDVNIWVGYKQVVWNYNVTDDVVKEFSSHADADYEISAKGVNYTFEDAPLIAWLAYNAAIQYKQQIDEKPTYNLDDL